MSGSGSGEASTHPSSPTGGAHPAGTDTADRRAGVLLPLFSIRTAHGWGLGEIPDIPRFARWARPAGLSILQLLPVNEVSGGETSPYAASSAFALDPVYLGLDDLPDFDAIGGRGALTPHERERLDRLKDAPIVQWTEIWALKQAAVDRAFAHFRDKEWKHGTVRAKALDRFVEEHREWLTDYALFRGIHDRENKAWWDWPEPLKTREPQAMQKARQELADVILKRHWLQWQLDEQWHRARAEARELGLALKGDLPFMVGGDSADVWSRVRDFRLDRRVGTPPDAFSATGQDWGLPAYDWDVLQKNNFDWLNARAARSGSLFDLYRIDHVIGLYRTWTRPAKQDPEHPDNGSFTPEKENEQIALGEQIVNIFKQFGEVVAEDLGMVPDFLRPSLTKLGVPGYKVLRWEKNDDGSFKDPATWPALSLATNGSHDIETNAVWYDALPPAEKKALLELPGLSHLDPDGKFDARVRDALLRAVYEAPSSMTINPLQDLLGARERVNVPGTVADSNWNYRMPMDLTALAADRGVTERLAALAAETARA